MNRILLIPTLSALALVGQALVTQAGAVTVTIGALDPSKLLSLSTLPVNDSNTAAPTYVGNAALGGYSLSPVGADGAIVVKGGINLNGRGPGGNRVFTAAPYQDPADYLAVQGGKAYKEKVSFAPRNSFSIYWGSVDPGNSITFYDGSTLIETFTGATLAADLGIVDNGGQKSANSNVLLTFSDFPANVTSAAIFNSTNSSFEFGLVAIPEASTWALMAIGFAGLAAAAGRRERNERLALGIE